jgi:hypothetical protein
MSLENRGKIIKHSPDSGGSNTTGGSSGTGSNVSPLDRVKDSYIDICDLISEDFDKVYKKKAVLCPLDSSKIAEINSSFSAKKIQYQQIFSNLMYANINEVRDKIKKYNQLDSLLENTGLPEEAQAIIEALILTESAKAPGGLNPLTIRTEESRNDFYQALEHIQTQITNNQIFLNSWDRQQAIKILNQLSFNAECYFKSELNIAMDKGLDVLKPSDISTLEALKVNSYLLGVVDEVEGYSGQIMGILNTEFEDQERQINIDYMNQNLNNFRRHFLSLTDQNEKNSILERYSILLDPKDPGFIRQIDDKNIELIYLQMFSMIESLSSIQHFISQILVNPTVDFPTKKKSKGTDSLYESSITNPVTRTPFIVKTIIHPVETVYSKARIRIHTEDINGSFIGAKIRIDPNKFGTLLDLDCGIISILIPSNSEDAGFTHHHRLEERTQKDAMLLGVGLPFDVKVSNEVENPEKPGLKVPHFDKICRLFEDSLQRKFSNLV